MSGTRRPDPKRTLVVALMRYVMIGRKGLLREPLLAAFERCGAVRPRSVIATGNVIFELRGSLAQFQSRLGPALRRRFRLEEPVYLRSIAQLRKLQGLRRVASFRDGEVYARCVSFGPRRFPLPPFPVLSSRGDVELLSRSGADVVSVVWRFGGGQGDPGGWLEKLTGAKFTTRAWSTIERLLAIAAAWDEGRQPDRREIVT
jgi:uncharacterized protein (DUF1697 family)